MPRTKRRKSRTGIYHVIFRGINKRKIFMDAEDYEQFLKVLKKSMEKSKFKLYAYCLMPNHIHLLIREGDEELGKTFQRIGASFVYWYNLKYGRVGHLFQDRYKSEAVEDERYFLTVIRYIHRNPAKAGLCREPEMYRYSSFANYETDPLIESDLAIKITGREQFYRYHRNSNEDKCLDIEERKRLRLNDMDAERIMREKYHCCNPDEFRGADRRTQELILRELLTAGGSLNQISRLTGVTIGVIRKYRQ